MPGRELCPMPITCSGAVPKTPDARAQALPESADLRFMEEVQSRPRGQGRLLGGSGGRLHAAPVRLAGHACLLPAHDPHDFP